jgi:4-amino-4-deoxy-L-arabinose transferase-like glycosyltransferase
MQPGHNWGGDFALYIEQSIALSTGFLDDLYEQNKFAMEHSQYAIGPFLYPIGFPIILSPFVAIFGLDFILLKYVVFLFFLGSFVLFSNFARQFTTNTWLILIASALYFLHPSSLTYVDNILSDFPYLFFTLLALLFYFKPRNTKNSLYLGLALFFSYTIRDFGLLLFLAFLLTDIIKNNTLKGLKSFSWMLPYLIFVLGFIFLKGLLPDGNKNHWILLIDSLHFFMILENYFYYLQLLQEFLYLPSNYLLIPIFMIIIIGILASFKKSLPVIIYLVFFGLILLLWPAKQGIRFLLPILPFLLLFTVIGIHTIVKFCKPILVKPLTISFIGIFCFNLYFFILEINDAVKHNSNAVDTVLAHELYSFVQNEISEELVIAFEKPRVLRLFTKRNAIFSTPEYFEESIADIMILHRYQYSEELEIYDKLFSSKSFVIIKK